MNHRLVQIEAKVERIIEGGFANLFPGKNLSRTIALKLARAVDDYSVPYGDGQRIAPSSYEISLYPDDHVLFSENRGNLLAELEGIVIEIAQTLGVILATPPSIRFVSDSGLLANDVQVRPPTEDFIGSTRQGSKAEEGSVALPSGREYLILDGTRQISLNRLVINLGRQRDNQIVLDDPEISRRHAQLQFRNHRWVIYDLDSSSGTQVNGHTITECILTPGDVIALAGVQLIFASEEPASQNAVPQRGETSNVEAQSGAE